MLWFKISNHKVISRVFLEFSSNVVPQVGQELMWEVWILSEGAHWNLSTANTRHRDGWGCCTGRGTQKIKFSNVSDTPLNSSLCQRTKKRLTRYNIFALFWQNICHFLTCPLTVLEMPSCNPKKTYQKPPKPKQNPKKRPKKPPKDSRYNSHFSTHHHLSQVSHLGNLSFAFSNFGFIQGHGSFCWHK